MKKGIKLAAALGELWEREDNSVAHSPLMEIYVGRETDFEDRHLDVSERAQVYLIYRDDGRFWDFSIEESRWYRPSSNTYRATYFPSMEAGKKAAEDYCAEHGAFPPIPEE